MRWPRRGGGGALGGRVVLGEARIVALDVRLVGGELERLLVGGEGVRRLADALVRDGEVVLNLGVLGALGGGLLEAEKRLAPETALRHPHAVGFLRLPVGPPDRRRTTRAGRCERRRHHEQADETESSAHESGRHYSQCPRAGWPQERCPHPRRILISKGDSAGPFWPAGARRVLSIVFWKGARRRRGSSGFPSPMPSRGRESPRSTPFRS